MGTTARLVFTGGGLLNGKLVWPKLNRGVSVSAVSSTDTRIVCLVTAALTCASGTYEVRIATPTGLSNPLAIAVDTTHEIQQSRGNSTRARARILSGEIGGVTDTLDHPTGEAWYSVPTHPPETLCVICEASRFGSTTRPTLELRNLDGQVVAIGTHGYSDEVRLVYHATNAARYYLVVRDSDFRTGPDQFFRIVFGPIPLATRWLPLGGAPDAVVGVDLVGYNLHGFHTGVVTVPHSSFGTQLLLPVRLGSVDTAVIPFISSSAPGAVLTESDALMPLLSPPVDMDGVFTRLRSCRFFFAAGPGVGLSFTVFGRSIGSAVEPELQIQDSLGREIAHSDGLVAGDTEIDFEPSQAAVYSLVVTNNNVRTGADCFYRLSVRVLRPDFQALAESPVLQLRSGETLSISVAIRRVAGLDGRASVSIVGLPPGLSFTTDPETGTGDTLKVRVNAAAGAEIGAWPVVLVATVGNSRNQITHNVRAISDMPNLDINATRGAALTTEFVVCVTRK